MQSLPTATYWKRKLAAFLHDSPEKVLSIVDHEQRARRIAGEDWLPQEQARKEADWAASAADRLPFPPSKNSKTTLSCFKHPLGGSAVALNEAALPIGLAEETSQRTRPVLENDTDPMLGFFATWRFWRNWASAQHADFALYPAETRLPDHTIWNHLAVTSAMQGCLGGSFKDWLDAKTTNGDTRVPDSPCFLLFTIGPVQDFISAARSTRDLWSGSYLLSYLIATVLKRIALDFGPDHVIFPNLCDQPLLDLLLKEDVWRRAKTNKNQTLLEAFNFYSSRSKSRLLTPTLPNRFLAVLPSKMVEHQQRGPEFTSADTYADHLSSALRELLQTGIAQRVRAIGCEIMGERFDAERFDQQVARMLDIHWQILPWPATFKESETLTDALPQDAPDKDYTPRAGLQTIRHLCQHGADSRYLDQGQPIAVAAAWSALYSTTDWLLDGAKATRSFNAQTGGTAYPSKTNTKDSLNGRDEAILLVEDDAEVLSAALEQKLGQANLLKKGESLAGATLIKRLWPYAFLATEHQFEPEDFGMPNTHSIAAGQPWANSNDDDTEKEPGEKYFAILALDGDSMGTWISGSKGQPLDKTLSEECQQAYDGADLASHKRPLSPSWHLQFSEALGNFSLHAVRRVVESFDGRLIYSGGDDVLAMLPANRALECARALRLAFRGDPDLNGVALGLVNHSSKKPKDRKSDQQTPLFAIDTPGFLKLAENRESRFGDKADLLDDPVRFPVIVPGPSADCSVGIAIAHFKSPLQDVVKAAQSAEKRAKKIRGKAAVAVSLFKRSGEINEWETKWDSGGMALYEALARCLDEGRLTGGFPYRICQLLKPHLTSQSKLYRQVDALTVEQASDLIQREFASTIDRQSARGKASENAAELQQLLIAYLAHLAHPHTPSHGESDAQSPVQHLITSVINLCSTVAFAHRTRTETNPAERQTAP
jgi:CRISPR-associated protein Cmr2